MLQEDRLTLTVEEAAQLLGTPEASPMSWSLVASSRASGWVGVWSSRVARSIAWSTRRLTAAAEPEGR